VLRNKSKSFWIKVGLISGYSAAFVFLVGTTIAMLIYPGYSFFYDFISELGVRQDIWIEGKLLAEALYPEALNITLIITGLLFFPFFPSLYFFLDPKQLWRKLLIFIVSLSGLVGGIFLSLVGVFDVGLFFGPHVTVALGTYFSITAVFLLWGIIVITLEKDSLYKNSKLWIVDPLICLLGIFVGVVNTGLFGLINYVGGIESLAFYQKSLSYIFVLLFCYVGVRMIIILKKNPDEFNVKNNNTDP